MRLRLRLRSRAFAVPRVRWASKWSGKKARPTSKFLVEITTARSKNGERWKTRKSQMKKEGKNIAKAHSLVEKRPYTLQDAVPLLQKVKFAKFDETVEVTLRLGVDPKHADQMVRGTVVLPHGLGKSKKVLVIASGDKIKEAEAAGGACFGGGEGGEE